MAVSSVVSSVVVHLLPSVQLIIALYNTQHPKRVSVSPGEFAIGGERVDGRSFSKHHIGTSSPSSEDDHDDHDDNGGGYCEWTDCVLLSPVRQSDRQTEKSFFSLVNSSAEKNAH